MAPPSDLDTVFAALADGTRRQVIERLLRGPATVTELAGPHPMSLPGFMKHLRVLEDAGLLARTKEGRAVSCELTPHALEPAATWLARYEHFWNERLDALGRFLYHAEETRSWPAKPGKTPPRSRKSPSPATTRPPSTRSGARGPTRKR